MQRILLILTSLIPAFSAFAQSTADGDKIISFGATYISESTANVSGGLKTGTSYLGLLMTGANLNLSNSRIAGGGELQVTLANEHGGKPSADFTGDFQGMSNIESSHSSFLYELWYKLTYSWGTLTLGLQDMSSTFATLASASPFLNSSFGIPSTVACNSHSPVYPCSAPGASAEIAAGANGKLLVGLFSGNPGDCESNKYNLKWAFGGRNGYFAAAEYDLQYEHTADFKSAWKLGAYVHRSQTADGPDAPSRNGTYGLYGLFETTIVRTADGAAALNCFAQAGLSPDARTTNGAYLGAGITASGLLLRQKPDLLGLAVARAAIRPTEAAETAVELFYQIPVDERIAVQPDFQYIIHPAAGEAPAPNAFAASLLFSITL